MLLILKKFWKKIIALFLGVLIVGIGVVGISPTAIKAASSNVKVIEIQESVLVNEISVKLEAKVSYCFNEQEKSDVLEDFDLSLGNDVIPDLDFEPEEATPTFESKEQEVANIAELMVEKYHMQHVIIMVFQIILMESFLIKLLIVRRMQLKH